MRRLLAIALLAALPAAAQMRVPPSAPAIPPSRSSPGVPSNFNSFGTSGIDPMFRQPTFGNGGIDPMFRNPAYGNGCFGQSCGFRSGRYPGAGHVGHGGRPGFGHNGRHRPWYPAYAPYYYYPYYYTEPAPAAEQYQPADADEEPPAPTIYERRSRTAYSTRSSDSDRDDDRYGEHFTDAREARRRNNDEARQAEEDRRRGEALRQAEAAEAAQRESKPADPEPVTVLVFKDGRRRELHGYAILGEVVYDLGAGAARKILLADLDLPATIKLNDELGNDFRLPSRPPRAN